MYNERVVFKKRMISKQQYERTKNPKLVKEIASATIFNAKKIALNSACAQSNQYFRYYDVRQQVLQPMQVYY